MKERMVVVTLEFQTNIPLKHLRDADRLALVVEGVSGFQRLQPMQAQANVIRTDKRANFND